MSKGWQIFARKRRANEQLFGVEHESDMNASNHLKSSNSFRSPTLIKLFCFSIASSSVFKRDKGWPYTGPHTLTYEMLDGFFG